MLEAVLEQLLLRFLAPYVDGISKDKLHLGVFSGSLELTGLQVKAEALALLGNPTLRIKKGVVGSLRLSVPWTQLHSGKLRVSVERLHLEVERIGDGGEACDEEIVRQLREAKRKAIALRGTQLRDLVKQRDEEEEEEMQEHHDPSDDEGFGGSSSSSKKPAKAKRQSLIAKLIRKVISNVHVELSDVKACYSSPSFGLACGLQLGGLDVVSTDAKFQARESARAGAVVVPDGALYKLLRLRELSLRMAPVGSSELTVDAAYVLHPVSARLRLAHEPRQGLLRTEFEVAHEDILELTIVRSQLKHLRGAQAARGRENARLLRLMVPEHEEQSIFQNASLNLTEYSSLYERQCLFQEGLAGEGDEPLSKKELRRLQLLEDALAIGLLARKQVLVQQRIDMVRDELQRQQRAAAAPAPKGGAQVGSAFAAVFRWWGGLGSDGGAGDGTPAAGAASGTSGTPQHGSLGFTSADHEMLARDLDDDSKFEEVDMPRRMRFEFRLGMFAVDMIDDRWNREDQRQVLSLALEEAQVSFSMNCATDYHGRDSAEWCLEINLGTFHAFQAAHVAFRFCPNPNRGGMSPHRTSNNARGPVLLDCGHAAKLVVASELGHDENVLKLVFDFAPTEIHMPQGLVEEIREFLRADLPPPGSVTATAARSKSSEDDSSPRRRLGRMATLRRSVSELDPAEQTAQVAEFMYGTLPSAVGSRGRARTMAQKVMERIPDKLEINVRIASPIFHVPVPSKGTTIFSLGMLHVQTPKPCEYSNLDIHCQLNEMVLCAVTTRGEKFDMFKPVLFNVQIQFKSNEEGSQVTVGVDAEKAGVTLVPQSLQMLMATPFAMASILWGKEEKKQPQEKPQPKKQQAVVQGGGDGTEVEILVAASVSDQPAEDQAAEGSVSEDNKEDAPPPPLRQFIFSMTVQFDSLDLTLADSVVPVMVLHMQWTPPGLQIYRHRLPHVILTTEIAFSLEVDILNPRNNAWEPLIEQFHGGVQYERECPDDSRHSKIIVSAGEELLLNLKPTMLQRFLWFTPVFMRGLTFEENLVVTSSDGATADVSKYRVLNLCNQTLELEFKSCHRTNLRTTIDPTGSQWEHLDKWVVSPYYATALAVRLPGGQFSEALSLEHDGAVAVPDSGLIAELLTPSPLDRMQHRMLLLGTALRVHNQTDLPLLVRFHTGDSEVLAVPLPSTMSCDGDLLGHFPKERAYNDFGHPRVDPHAATDDSALVLLPNAFGVVPVPALVREQGTDVGISHAWLSVKPPVSDYLFCSVVNVGANTEAQTIHCKKRRGSDTSKGPLLDVHLVCESHVETVLVPRPITLTTIKLQAPLALVNALPFGDLIVGYGPKMVDQTPTDSWQEARIPHLKQLNLYNFPGNLVQDGISVRARLAKGAPWSSLFHFGHGALQDAGATRTIQLRQKKEGAAAGVVIEHVDGFRLRFSCPFWFVDRSGLHESLGLKLTSGGQSLPQGKGITLLPSKCLEEDCELMVASSAALVDCTQILLGSRGDFCVCSGAGPRAKVDRAKGTASYKVRMPPNFSILTMSTRMGPGVFCLHTEDVNRKDMLGAECHVITLRPRLILTNSSEHEIEISPEKEGTNLLLAPGTSSEMHWAVKSGDEDSPSTSLLFRPVCNPPCQWSGSVLCSDVAAGSKAFLLLATPGSRLDADPSGTGARALGFGVPQVWSAEVAPMRGALAVSFRAGSVFAAVNRSSKVKMTIRPLDNGKPLADIPVPPHGQEVPFGWSRPFQGTQTHAIDAMIGGHMYHIDDIRRTRRRVVPTLHVVVSISRVGSQTILSLEDQEVVAPGGQAKDVGKSTMQFDLRLSRLGISLIDEVPQPRELLYIHLDLIRLEMKKTSETDTKSIKFVISDVQVDCQLPGRADGGRVDASAGTRHDLPAVLLANCGHGDRMFLKLLIEQGATSSADIMIPRAEISFDRLDFSIDDGWVEAVTSFARQCRSGSGNQGMSLASIERTAGSSIVMDFSPPPLPSVVQVEQLHVDTIKLNLWCALKLRSCGFLPSYIRDALRVLSFSDELTLEDATLSLPERKVPLHRGSLRDFLRGLASEYTMNLVNNAGVALGKSSLLNLPRVPLRIGGSTVSFLSDTMGLVAGEAASLMNHLTFDDEYVARQREIRSRKQIHGFADGMHEAGRSLGQGIVGVFDVVTKPAEGWRAGGLQGAVVGVGQGVASGFVKPISNLGQAISDVGAGISAAVGPDSFNAQRRRARPRHRLPRLLFSDGGAIRRWSAMEAELLWQLGARHMRGIQEIVCILQEGQQHWVLLLYTYQLELVELKLEHATARSGSSSSGSQNGPEKAPDIMGAIDESTEKVFWQAVKPITKLVSSMRELGQAASSRYGGGALTFERLKFDDLRDVRMAGDGAAPLLELVDAKGIVHSLPLYCGPSGVMSDAVRSGLFSGFGSARSHAESAANWGTLRTALKEEERGREASEHDALLKGKNEAGQITLEVFEVERWMITANEWQTPCLPTDSKLKWRWVDVTGQKHPHLLQRLLKKEAAAKRVPPIELDTMFQTADEWTIEKGAGTDADGWSYGISWRSSTWDAKPGLFDVLRRRKWQRTYK
mmetsp:Transcript_61203/g.197864  ORF Transcript_61203/g.197864 Transcript_61203/m.197864 type:complete len:2568 (-) Transcript_61203:194-7897(-)